MKTQENLHAQETDPRLLEALASLNQISAAINHIDPSDAGNRAVSLQLIVESSIRVIPGSSAVIYTYDQAANAFEDEFACIGRAGGTYRSIRDERRMMRRVLAGAACGR